MTRSHGEELSRRDTVRRSKRISLLLRHDPGRGDLDPDPAGWVGVDDLLDALEDLGQPTTDEQLDDLVEHGSKPRFEREGGRIRARYGHSIDVDPGYEATDPPAQLYHGTASRKVATILEEGIAPMGRQMVHLSADIPTAYEVGSRHGAPVVLVVDAARMAADGHAFYALPGGTWLTTEVDTDYLLGSVGETGRSDRAGPDDVATAP